MDKTPSRPKPRSNSRGQRVPVASGKQLGRTASPATPGAAPRKDGGTQYVVRGHVTGAITGCVVRAYDKDLRGEEPLGKEELAGTGDYAILYSPKQFKRAE